MKQETDISMSRPAGKKQGGMIFFLMTTAILFSLVLSFCTPQSCFEETKATVKVMFYDTTGKSRTPDSLTIMGIGADTTELYRKEKNIRTALLPLDATDGNSVFLVRIDGINDTLTFNYTSFPHLISQECGYAFYHTLSDSVPLYSTNIIRRILIKNRNITTINEENIRIYY